VGVGHACLGQGTPAHVRDIAGRNVVGAWRLTGSTGTSGSQGLTADPAQDVESFLYPEPDLGMVRHRPTYGEIEMNRPRWRFWNQTIKAERAEIKRAMAASPFLGIQ
jgi:hypothetical protein